MRAVDKSNVVVTLQDEVGGLVISVPGKIKTSKREGTTITLDLSKKGGPIPFSTYSAVDMRVVNWVIRTWQTQIRFTIQH